jgi:hypothetical protein
LSGYQEAQFIPRITQSISAFAQQLWNNNHFYNSTSNFNNRFHLLNRNLPLQIQFQDQVRESRVDHQAPKTKQRTRLRERRTTHLKGSLGLLPKSSHRTPLERMQMHLSSILLLFFTMGGVQTRPLFDFLPPVIIDKNQQISTNHNDHTTIFYPVGKYATDVHYMIIRIPIFLQPVEDGLKRCGEVLHHMVNAIKGKATEAPIKDIIKFHNYTFHRVNFNYNNM